nr:cytochrome c [Gammaproteobacteria bacterium]
ALYEEHCAACHSIEGEGSIFKDYPPVKGTALETLDIVHRVKGSAPQNRKMPTFTELNEAEAELIARFIKSL